MTSITMSATRYVPHLASTAAFFAAASLLVWFLYSDHCYDWGGIFHTASLSCEGVGSQFPSLFGFATQPAIAVITLGVAGLAAFLGRRLLFRRSGRAAA